MRFPIDTGHRPWPPPPEPWVMFQRWHELLFAHWEVPAQQLRVKVPPELELDTRDGSAWLGITPFRMSNVRPRLGPPLPWVSAFPELNVRTYVKVEGKPGVYFFSLDAGNPLAVAAARALFHLPYHQASMRVTRDLAAVHYSSRRTRSAERVQLVASYRAKGKPVRAAAGSLEHWLTERYCLYSLDRDRRVYRVEIHHAPWMLETATAEISV